MTEASTAARPGMASQRASLELIGLTRRFGSVVALDGLTFSVPPGHVFGFLGPNGAGKTTTMRAIFGVVALDAGEVRWQGEPVTEQARRRFGYMPEERGLFPSMPVLDQLAAALMHDPELLVLDEPFAGLDPGGVDDMTVILAERARAGVTVLFSSHQLDLVEHICESVAIILRGRVVAQGAVADLERGDRPRLAVRVAGDPAGDWARRLDPELASVEQVTSGTVLIALAPGARPANRAVVTCWWPRRTYWWPRRRRWWPPPEKTGTTTCYPPGTTATCCPTGMCYPTGRTTGMSYPTARWTPTL